MDFLHRTWAEIDIDALIHNFNLIKEKASGKKLFCVVKANAYGHGTADVVKALSLSGADAFAVSNIEEALEVRSIAATADILILGYTPPEMADILAENKITQAVYSLKFARELNRMAREKGVQVGVHIKVDTGMGRIGFDLRDDTLEGMDEILSVYTLEALRTDGIFTHFAASDRDGDEDASFTTAQFNRFSRCIDNIKAAGYDAGLCHCANSAAFLIDEDKRLDACRPGIILYGLDPAPALCGAQSLIPVMTLKSVVSFIKDIKAGETVSYGRSYTAKKPTRVATIPAGYADGYPRLLSNKGCVIINGQKADIIGKVCMDQLCVDITGLDGINEGDEVILFGKELPASDLAKLIDTIHYELVCGITKRVPRITVKGTK